MGQLFPLDVLLTKQLEFYAVLFTYAISLLLSLFMYQYQSGIFLFFTTDYDVLDAIWGEPFPLPSCIIAGIRLPWRMAAALVAVLWCIFLPLLIFYSVIKGGGLVCLGFT
jgi:hypothetical protein